MGISVVSSINPASPANAPASALSSSGTAAGPLDFLALLSQQLGGQTISAAPAIQVDPAAAATFTDALPDSRDTLFSGGAPLQQALAALVPATTPIGKESPSATGEPSGEEEETVAGPDLAALFPGLIAPQTPPPAAAPAPALPPEAGVPTIALTARPAGAAPGDNRIQQLQDDAEAGPAAMPETRSLFDRAMAAAGNQPFSAGQNLNHGEAATIAGKQPEISAPASQPSAAAPLAGLAAQRPPEPPPLPVQIATPLHDQGWAQDFGQKLVWMANKDQQVAQININPPQLGPMHVTINLNGDQASAVFASPHAEVRQVLQDAIPQLREMLADAGINLGQANVGAQLPQQQNPGTPQQFSAQPRLGGDNAILPADSAQGTVSLPAARSGGLGLVDLFA